MVRCNMGLIRHFAGLVTVAIVFIALVAAPSVASAHSGHSHASVPAAHQIVVDGIDVSAEKTTTKAPSEVSTSTASHSLSSDTGGCTERGCCSGAPCTACCVAA